MNGRRILDGARHVNLFGEDVKVSAQEKEIKKDYTR